MPHGWPPPSPATANHHCHRWPPPPLPATTYHCWPPLPMLATTTTSHYLLLLATTATAGHHCHGCTTAARLQSHRTLHGAGSLHIARALHNAPGAAHRTALPGHCPTPGASPAAPFPRQDQPFRLTQVVTRRMVCGCLRKSTGSMAPPARPAPNEAPSIFPRRPLRSSPAARAPRRPRACPPAPPPRAPPAWARPQRRVRAAGGTTRRVGEG